MSEFKIYKSYSFHDKDPIIDRMRTVFQDEFGGSYAKAQKECEVSVSTMYSWFEKDTRRPQFATCAAFFSSCGYDLLPVKRGSVRTAKVVPIRARKAG